MTESLRQRVNRLGSGAGRRESLAAYGLISPWAIGFVALTAGPMLASLALSFTDYRLIDPGAADWVGVDNYARALTDDPLVWQALRVTAYYATLSVALELVVGFALALLLDNGLRGIGIVRTIYYLPAVISGVAVSLLWLLIFQPSSGLANALLEFLGLPRLRWVYSTTWVIPAFVLMSLWGVGRAAFIYLAILQRIPTNLYEAAAVDGTGSVRRFLRITLPLATPAIFINLVLAVIGRFQIFTEGFVISEGGPGTASLFYVLYLYRNAFRYFEVGYASALAWILFVILLVLTLIIFRTGRRWVYYEGERRET